MQSDQSNAIQVQVHLFGALFHQDIIVIGVRTDVKVSLKYNVLLTSSFITTSLYYKNASTFEWFYIKKQFYYSSFKNPIS